MRPDLRDREPKPPYSLRKELRGIAERRADLAELLTPPPEGPEMMQTALVTRGAGALLLIRIPVEKRPGALWVSRLPGRVNPTRDVDALARFGIQRVYCLVPQASLIRDYQSESYLVRAREAFGDRFRTVEIVDHDVPAEDGEFEHAVEEADEALRRGESILVHCIGGCGRTGMFGAALLILSGLKARDAILAFRRARRCGPETMEQLAYVVRYAERRRRVASNVRLRIVQDEKGEPVLLARGGLAVTHIGRLHLPFGRPKRVAVKRFRYAVDDTLAAEFEVSIQALLSAGVRLPKMAMIKLDDGQWVQVSQLFGSRNRGSKLHQPSNFYRELAAPDRLFAADQLTRVANAGYLPSVDLFVAFRDPSLGIIPLDLDLVRPEPDPQRRATELLKRLIQVGSDRKDRERLWEVSLACASPDIAEHTIALLANPDSPYRRLWDGL